jgi:hypothetical protein
LGSPESSEYPSEYSKVTLPGKATPGIATSRSRRCGRRTSPPPTGCIPR